MLKKSPGGRRFCCDSETSACQRCSIEPTGRCMDLFPILDLILPQSSTTWQFSMEVCSRIKDSNFNLTEKKNSAENAARVMQQDILNELNEINLCSYCYIRSNEQERDDWFCLPCEPQHELVYAKAKGYPYWPAKASAPYSFYLFLDNVCFKINKNRFLKSVAIFTTFDFLDPNMRDWRLIKATQNRLIVTSIH